MYWHVIQITNKTLYRITTHIVFPGSPCPNCLMMSLWQLPDHAELLPCTMIHIQRDGFFTIPWEPFSMPHDTYEITHIPWPVKHLLCQHILCHRLRDFNIHCHRLGDSYIHYHIIMLWGTYTYVLGELCTYVLVEHCTYVLGDIYHVCAKCITMITYKFISSLALIMF
jgi:hypothetical protein